MTALLKSTYRIGIFITMSTMLGFTSCSDENITTGDKTEQLSFSVAISNKWTPGTRSQENASPKHEAYKLDDSDMWIIASDEEGIESSSFSVEPIQTKGAPVESAQALSQLYNSFGVYAYVWKEGEDETNAKPYITKEEVGSLNRKDETWWIAQSQHYWPAAGHQLKFYAFAPYSIQPTQQGNSLQFDYTVPPKSGEQKDLLLASPKDPLVKPIYTSKDHDVVKLSFRHLLTAVKVRAAKGITGKIQKVTISGVRNKGTFQFDKIVFEASEKPHYGIDKNKWVLDESTSSFEANASEYTGSNAGKDEDGYEQSFFVDGEATFMMLPQELPADATLTVAFEDGKSLSGKIGVDAEGNAKEWKMGHTVVYRISEKGEIEDDIVFIVTANKTTIPNAGCNDYTYTVTSYNQKDNSNIAWKIERIEGNIDMLGKINNQPWWSKDDMNYNHGEGSKNGETKSNIPITNFNGFASSDPELDLQNNSIFDTHPIDLSRKIPRGLYTNENGQPDHSDKKQKEFNLADVNTANCYIVPGQEEYVFPLVYGNGIQNGEENKKAFQDFYDYSGQKITSPYIKEPTENLEFCIIWQNHSKLIQSLAIQEDYTNGKWKDEDGKSVRYVKFRLVTENISGKYDRYRQANAVIGLKNKTTGKLIWSWHIWMTAYRPDLGNLIDRNGYKFYTYDLGYCGSVSSSRKCIIHFRQTGNDESQNKTAKLILTQGEDGTIEIPASVLHYQWGRKDPFDYGTNQLYENPRPQDMGANREITYSVTSDNGSFESGIIPTTFYIPQQGTNWWKEPFTQLWQSNLKTVYDPCPAGYQIPSLEVLQQIAEELPDANMRYGEIITTGNFHWASDYNSGYPGHYTTQTGTYNTAYGFAIRPVKEE